MVEPETEKNFDEWYNEIVEKAELCDKRYPIKGMNVWLPYGWNLMQNIDAIIREEMKKTGHKEVYFPLLIPEIFFKKEEEHIKGFSQEVFWVTHAGKNELEEKMLLRPTSETAIYPMFSLWIRSHADLPLKIYQIVNTFRYETKMTKAFIRVREIHFFEAHTAHATFEEAENQVKEDIKIAEKFFRKLCIPFLLSRRPEWDKFAGAFYSIGIDVLMPSLRALQVGSIHQYKQNFSKPFDIRYESMDGKHHYCHQTTYGMSERVLGAIIGLHGDEKGLVLPSSIAPIKIVIVPILFKGWEEKIMNECKKLKEEIELMNLSCHVDERDKTPGNKFYDWELKGVPLRIEVGPRDIQKGVFTLVSRDGIKKEINRNEIEKIKDELVDFDERLYDKAKKFMNENIHRIKKIEGKEGIVEIPWCGNEECSQKIEEKLDMKSLGVPLEKNNIKNAKCPICGEKATKWLRLAKSY